MEHLTQPPFSMLLDKVLKVLDIVVSTTTITAMLMLFGAYYFMVGWPLTKLFGIGTSKQENQQSYWKWAELDEEQHGRLD
jgi:hypothetical protein